MKPEGRATVVERDNHEYDGKKDDEPPNSTHQLRVKRDKRQQPDGESCNDNRDHTDDE